MTKKFSFLALTAVLAVLASQVQADLITVSQVGAAGTPTRKVTEQESNGAGAGPVNGDVYQFQVTTDADILSINGIAVTLNGGATLYNNALGDASDAEPGNPLLLPVAPAIAVDSWITTPGATSLLGAKLPGDGVDTTYGDLTSDGAQTNFVFAQLTVPAGTMGNFKGFVSIAGGGGTTVYSVPFDLPIGVPEPATLALAGMGLIGLVAVRRRQA